MVEKMVEKLNIIKEDERGTVYDCDNFLCIMRKRGTVTADHTHEDRDEILFLIQGSIELTIADKTKKVETPSRIEIPNKTYHKIVAISEVIFLKKK